jgi:hypothetical protein
VRHERSPENIFPLIASSAHCWRQAGSETMDRGFTKRADGDQILGS